MSTEPLLIEAAEPVPVRTHPGLFAGLTHDAGVVIGTAVIVIMVVIGAAAPWLA